MVVLNGETLTDSEIRQIADEIADTIVDMFAREHPVLAMTFLQWADLRQMIEAEVFSRWTDST